MLLQIKVNYQMNYQKKLDQYQQIGWLQIW